MGHPNVIIRPELVQELYGFRPAGQHGARLLAIHHWTGFPDNRHVISMTSIDEAGPRAGQQVHGTMMLTPTLASRRMTQHLVQLFKTDTLIDPEEAYQYLERLAGRRDYACAACNAMLRPGAEYCGWVDPRRRRRAGTRDNGCGTAVPKVAPARATA